MVVQLASDGLANARVTPTLIGISHENRPGLPAIIVTYFEKDSKSRELLGKDAYLIRSLGELLSTVVETL